MVKQALAWGLALALAVPAPAALAEDLLGAEFESFTGIPSEGAEMLRDEEMEELRGGFLGIFFSVELRGFVENDSVMDANLDVNVGFVDASGKQLGNLFFPGGGGDPSSAGNVNPAGVAGAPNVTLTNPATGESFRVGAIIDSSSFSNSNFVAQISQIPGNGNNVFQALVINLAVIEVAEPSFSAVQSRIAPMFGF